MPQFIDCSDCTGHTSPETPENRKNCLEMSLNEIICPENLAIFDKSAKIQIIII